MRTKCCQACGLVIQDSYLESMPGSVKETLSLLDAAYAGHGSGSRVSPVLPTTTLDSSSASTIGGHWGLSGINTWFRKAHRDGSRNKPPEGTSHQRQTQNASQSTPTRWLFLCITQVRSYRMTERKSLLVNLADDEAMFRRLRQEFSRTLGFWRRLMMLKQVDAVRFVQVCRLPVLAGDSRR